MIYLASPYSHAEQKVREERFRAVCLAAAKLMAKGLLVFCPIAHTHPIREAGNLPIGFDFWEKYDRWFIERSDAIVVLTIDGWQESAGVQAEIKIADELNKEIQLWNGSSEFSFFGN